jgi:pimeloyl-ACP methyl ester carboxylesterase
MPPERAGRSQTVDSPMSVAMTIPMHAAPTGGDLLVTLPDGRRLGYADYGDPGGIPIFGLHGTPGSRRMFQLAHQTASALNIRLIAPERPGFGISCYHRGRDLTSYAGDLAHFADALGIDRFAVAGVSGGSPYAAACAALLPERVTALGLISPIGPMAGVDEPPRIGPGHYFAFRLAPKLTPLMAGLFGIGRLAFLYAPDLIFQVLLSRAAPSDRAILRRADVRRNLLAGVAEGCRPGVAASLQEMRIFSRPWNVPFANIQAPALLWQGLGDRNVPVSAALRLGQLIPRCRISRIEGGGHYWIFDNIGNVLKDIADAAKRGPGPAA